MSEQTPEKKKTSAYNFKSFTQEERDSLKVTLRYAGTILLAIAITLIIVGLIAALNPDAQIALGG
ncbi:MAG: hypothetical protein ACPG7F_02360 [Aggregatilineales bacterium]